MATNNCVNNYSVPPTPVNLFVRLATALSDVTGDQTIVYPVKFDTIVSDTAGGYDTSTGHYTCGSTGLYQHNLCIVTSFYGGADALPGFVTATCQDNTGAGALSAVNLYFSPVTAAANGTYGYNASWLFPMVSGRYYFITFAAGGSTTKNVTILGNIGPMFPQSSTQYSCFKIN